jgi:hypothetical protein
MESPFLTLSEAATYARMSTRTIQRRLKDGELKRYGAGRPLVLKTELEALLSASPAKTLEEKS